MEGINFIPYSAPVEYIIGSDGKVTDVEYDANFPTKNDPNNLGYKKTGQVTRLPVDHVIQSFGCQLPDEDWVNKIKKSENLIDVDFKTHRTKAYDWLYVGGDCIGTKNLVDAVNDGKTASWNIHKQI